MPKFLDSKFLDVAINDLSKASSMNQIIKIMQENASQGDLRYRALLIKYLGLVKEARSDRDANQLLT